MTPPRTRPERVQVNGSRLLRRLAPHPDYVSTHSVFGSESSVILARFFGGDAANFTLTTSSAPPGVYRSFTSFSQASHENGDSRVYAGIHFRTACDDGVAMGERIGNFIMDDYLLPVR